MKGTDFEPLRCQAAKTDKDYKHVEIFQNFCNYGVSYFSVKDKAGKVLFNADRFEEAEKFAEKHDYERKKNKPPLNSEFERMDRLFKEFRDKYIDNQNTEDHGTD